MQTKLCLWEFISLISKKCGYLLVIAVLAGNAQWISADNSGSITAVQQQITVTGIVLDEFGEPLPGVAVTLKGSPGVGIATNSEGRFSLNIPDENSVLVFTFIGFTTQEVTVGRQRELTVKLLEDVLQMDEVVVTGYSSQRKATLTGSISSVNNKELTITKNENVVNMLSGKMPGLRISQKSAQPGQYNTVIDVRGYGEPLFVIDGIPRDKDYFARMDAEEIETISILKDASAAVYGMRAANGVMLITTKSGTAQQGKMDISYSMDYSIQQMIYVPEGITPYDWMTLRNEQQWQDFGQNYLNRRDPRHGSEEMNAWAGRTGTDWMGATFRKNTPQQKHNLSIDGGTETLRYFVSLGYARQDGSYASGSLWEDRWNLRSTVDAKITKRLSARVQLGAIINNNHEPSTGIWTVYKNAWLQRTDAPIYANNNPQFPNGDDVYISDQNNSVIVTDANYVGNRKQIQRRLNGSLMLMYDIPGVKGLQATAMYDYGMRINDNTEYTKSFYLYKYNETSSEYEPILRNSPAGISRQAWFNNDTDLQIGLSYINKFGEHSVNARVVFEELYQDWDNFRAYRELLVNSQYLFAGEDKNQSATGGTPGDRLNQALIGQFNYDYAQKYLVDFRFRYDGSSRWPANKRWGFFPSISLGWRLSEENFIKDNVDFISNLKLRGSYGEMGDDSAGSNYPPIFVGYNLDANNRGWYFDDVLAGGVSPTSIPNPNLTWYKVTMKNIALEFDIYRSLLSGTFELFQRDRSGLLATSSAVIPGTVGANLPQENLNADRNFGWEIELAHRNRINDISYFISGQLSATRGKRTKWLEEPANHSRDHWRNRTEGRYTQIWWDSREQLGMFDNINDIRNFTNYPMGQGALPGDWYALDWNGDGIINGDDDHPVATQGLPFFNFGLSMGGSYKNFDLSLNFQGAYGIYLSLSEVFTEALPFGGRNTLSWFMDRWRPENPDADYFAADTKWISGWYPVTGHDGRRAGTNNKMNASYARLKTIELGYTLPRALMSKIGVKGLRIFFSGYNLLTISTLKDLDPERPGSTRGVGASDNDYVDMYAYPNNRTFTFGASLKF